MIAPRTQPYQRRGPSNTTLPGSPHDEATGAMLGSAIEINDYTLNRNPTEFQHRTTPSGTRYVPAYEMASSRLMPTVARPQSPALTRAWCMPHAAWLTH